MEKQNRREFLKNTLTAGTGFAISCGFFSGCCSSSCKNNKSASAEKSLEDFDHLAYCCLNCYECELFIATRDNNEQLKAKVVQKWNIKKDENFNLQDFGCLGCNSEKLAFFCTNCPVKKCAIQKGFQLCAQCDELDSCDKELWKNYPEIKENAINVRAKLRA